MPRKTKYKAHGFNRSFEHSNLINWSAMSILLSGDAKIVRSDFVPVKYHEELVKLMVFITRWANKNKHPDYKDEIQTVKRGNSIYREKVFKKANQFTEVLKIPEDSVKIEKGIYQNGEKFYTDKFNINTGPDVKEWYSLEKAREYITKK